MKKEKTGKKKQFIINNYLSENSREEPLSLLT